MRLYRSSQRLWWCVFRSVVPLEGSQDHMVCCLHQQPAQAFCCQLGVRSLGPESRRQAARFSCRSGHESTPRTRPESETPSQSFAAVHHFCNSFKNSVPGTRGPSWGLGHETVPVLRVHIIAKTDSGLSVCPNLWCDVHLVSDLHLVGLCCAAFCMFAAPLFMYLFLFERLPLKLPFWRKMSCTNQAAGILPRMWLWESSGRGPAELLMARRLPPPCQRFGFPS